MNHWILHDDDKVQFFQKFLSLSKLTYVYINHYCILRKIKLPFILTISPTCNFWIFERLFLRISKKLASSKLYFKGVVKIFVLYTSYSDLFKFAKRISSLKSIVDIIFECFKIIRIKSMRKPVALSNMTSALWLSNRKTFFFKNYYLSHFL